MPRHDPEQHITRNVISTETSECNEQASGEIAALLDAITSLVILSAAKDLGFRVSWNITAHE